MSNVTGSIGGNQFMILSHEACDCGWRGCVGARLSVPPLPTQAGGARGEGEGRPWGELSLVPFCQPPSPGWHAHRRTARSVCTCGTQGTTVLTQTREQTKSLLPNYFTMNYTLEVFCINCICVSGIQSNVPCPSLPNSVFSDITLVAWNWPW